MIDQSRSSLNQRKEHSVLNVFKNLLVAALICVAGTTAAQTVPNVSGMEVLQSAIEATLTEAQKALASEPPAAVVEAEFSVYARKSGSLPSVKLYGEREITNLDISVWGELYHDKYFRSAYIGVGKSFGDITVGVGVGPAWYDNSRRTALNIWSFYKNDQIEVSFEVERYLGDKVSPWYYKAYAYTGIGNNVSVGAFAEKGVGVGPAVTWHPSESMALTLVVPVAKRPAEDRTNAILTLKFSF